ncbi:hypothetical protein K7711_06055 [Nocardia sp. CA2R105]|uniref:hypothetical protein n=1 Tax=Nocardia coffeae TaxID=2873381 RepID=UPI001CA747F7|nr:hypothetical protein [Nocardia coffeae]MBY8856034.1 hypothetical protein [Nocardia coffeae]
MAEFVLTSERRTELAALLADEQRLNSEYPKVAEYLDAAPILPGTGDERADAAFDLRLLHYLTGDRSISTNPYWDIVAPSVSEHDGRRVVNGGRPTGSARLGFAQTILQSAYAYAIPSPETIDWMARFCAGRTVVELGAGRGYWASRLRDAGLTVEAYDSHPPDRAENVSFTRAAGQPDVWFPVAPSDNAPAHSPDDVLFLCWPPGWDNPMASDALAAFESTGGRHLVYIGEPQGGKTADTLFFDALTSGWTLKSEDPHYVSWWNLTDTAQTWVRRQPSG